MRFRIRVAFAAFLLMTLVTSAQAAVSSQQQQGVEREIVEAQKYINGAPTGEPIALTLFHIVDGKGHKETIVDLNASSTVEPPPYPVGCGAGCNQIDAHTSTYCAGGQGVTEITYVYKDSSGKLYFQTVDYTYNSPGCRLNSNPPA